MAEKQVSKRGRPVGTRMATVELDTLSFKAPKEFADRVRRYSKEHRCGVSELVRDGLEWRISEQSDPRAWRPGAETSGETVNEGNTGNTAKVEMGVEFLHGMLSALVEEVRQLRESMQTIEQRLGETGSVQAPSVTGNTDIVCVDGDMPKASMKAQMGELGSVQASSVSPVAMAPMVKVDKEEVLARIQQMRDEGLDSAQITKELQAEGVPTLSAEAQLQAVVEILEHRAIQDGSEGDTGIISADGDIPVASMEAQSGEPGRVQVPSDSPASILPKVKSDKAEILARLQQMRETGLDSTQIAAVLQGEGVPTLKGVGQWHGGTVRKLLGAIKTS